MEALDARVMPSATPLHLAVMGDSLSAPYAGQPYGAAGDQSWVEQLRTLRPGKVVITDEAFAGATSNSLLHGEAGHPAQAPAVADLVAHHDVQNVFLMIGANDVAQDLPLLATDPAGFISTYVHDVVGNVEAAYRLVAAAGPVHFVIGNLPDVTVTPAFQAGVPAAALPIVEKAITLANKEIEAFAAAHELPVVDLYGLTHLSLHPFTVGGTQITNLFAPDYFHPNTVGQGLLADTILEAFHEGYGVHTNRIRLSDQQILTEAHLADHPGRSFFNVHPYVLTTEEFAGGDHEWRHEEGWGHRRPWCD